MYQSYQILHNQLRPNQLCEYYSINCIFYSFLYDHQMKYPLFHFLSIPIKIDVLYIKLILIQSNRVHNRYIKVSY